MVALEEVERVGDVENTDEVVRAPDDVAEIVVERVAVVEREFDVDAVKLGGLVHEAVGEYV